METIRVAYFGRRISANGAHNHGIKVANFFRQMGRGRIDIETFGVAMPEEFKNCDTRAPRYGYEYMRETWAMLLERPDLLPTDENGDPLPIPDWEGGPTHWYMLGGWHQGQCGQANFGGTVGRTNTDQGCGINTTAHEGGHMRPFRLLHSNVREPDGTLREYKDRTGMMGSSAPLSQHAPHMVASGLLDNDEGTTVTKNCRLSLIPWEVESRARNDSEFAFAYIGLNPQNLGLNGRAFVSTRKMQGYPWRCKQEEPTVYLHVANTAESWLVDTIELGETSTVFPGVEVEFIGRYGDESEVEIRFADDNTPVKDMTGDAELPPQPGVLPEPGIYGNPYTLGQGVDLQSSEKGTALFWYTFDDEAYRQWYVAEFEHGEHTADLYAVVNADFSDPSAGERVEIGTVRFIEHQGQVHLDFDTDVHGRGSILMEAVPGVKGHPAGAYYTPARDGEGFTLRFIEDRVVGYWYTYELTVKKGTWFYLEGERAERNTFDVKMYRARAPFNAHNVGEPFLFFEGEATLFQTDGGYIFRVDEGDFAIESRLVRII